MILAHSDTFFPILNLAVGFLIFSMLVMCVFVFTFYLRWNLFIALLTDFTTQLSFSMPGGLPSLGSHRVGHDWSDLAATACFLMFRKISLYFVGTKDLFFSWNCKPENILQKIFLFFFCFFLPRDTLWLISFLFWLHDLKMQYIKHILMQSFLCLLLL